MKTCPDCKTKYPDESTFCRRDGNRLVPDEARMAVSTGTVPVSLHEKTPELALDSTFQPVSPRSTNAAVADDVLPKAESKLVCTQCHKSIAEADTFCPRCGAPNPTLRVRCPHCADDHLATLRFCPKTGERIHPKSIHRLSKKPAIAGATVLLLLVLGYFGYAQFTRSKPDARISALTATQSTPSLVGNKALANAANSNRTRDRSLITSATGTISAHPAPLRPIATFTDGVANASSFEAPHIPQDAFDGNTNTIWHTEDYQNAWISVRYPAARYVTEVSIIAGSLKAFRESACIKTVRIRFSDGQTQLLALQDTNQFQVRCLAHPILTDSLKFEILDLYPGRTNHLIVPEIVVRGYQR